MQKWGRHTARACVVKALRASELDRVLQKVWKMVKEEELRIFMHGIFTTASFLLMWKEKPRSPSYPSTSHYSNQKTCALSLKQEKESLACYQAVFCEQASFLGVSHPKTGWRSLKRISCFRLYCTGEAPRSLGWLWPRDILFISTSPSLANEAIHSEEKCRTYHNTV